MKITVEGVAPDPQGLRLYLTVAHEKAGWIRFETCVLLVDSLESSDRVSLMEALNNTARLHAHGVDVPLF